jgi:hypothetical protein
MRSRLLAVPLAGLFVAACDSPVTGPRATQRQTAASRLYLLNAPTWYATALPFEPRSINDAGVIVGQANGEAIRWQNGTAVALPHLPGVTGGYFAQAITPKGIILGGVNGHALVWTDPTATPIDISQPGVFLAPVAINDNLSVVGNQGGWYDGGWAGTDCHTGPWTWTPSTGITYLPPNAYCSAAMSMNASGTVGGYAYMLAPPSTGVYPPTAAVLWSSTGAFSVVGSENAEDGVAAINDHNDMLLWVSDSIPIFGWPYYQSVWGLTLTIVHADGTRTALPMVPGGFWYYSGLSNAGRVIANYLGPWTWFNGTQTRLPYSSPFAPKVRAVNTCGWIVGADGTDVNAGFLWRRSGLSPTATCDVAPVLTAG